MAGAITAAKPDSESSTGHRGCCRSSCALTVASVASTALVAGVWVLEHHPGEDHWLGALAVYGPQVQWVVPPALALVATLLTRRGALSAMNLAALMVALFTLAGLQMNNPAQAPPGRPTMRVATWNVYGYTRDLERVRSRIASWNCDVVCLQEAKRPEFADLLDGYASAESADVRTYVRGDIVSSERVPLRSDPPRHALVVRARTDAGPVTIINVHFPRARGAHPTPRELEPLKRYLQQGVKVRDTKFSHLLEALPREGPMLVLGDMNTPPTSRNWRRLRERLTDAFDAAGRGFGHTFVWRRRLPLLRIDYVWANASVRPLRCWTLGHRPSDHRPVLADLALPAVDATEPAGREDGT